MIKIKIYKNKNSEIYGFQAENHGDPIVCSAVSMLTMNTINSIEAFTDEHIICEYDEKGGYLEFQMPDIKSGKTRDDVKLLMDSMMLGLKALENDYGKHIRILDEEV